MTFLLLLSLFVVSADVIFVLHLGGFTLRLFQLLTVPVLVVGVRSAWHNPRALQWPLGFKNLLLWACFILLFVPNTSYLPRNVGYMFWLILDILLVLGLTAAINTPEKLRQLLKWYIYSFAVLAAFGLLQLVTPLLGLPGLLVQQWWFPGTLARISGLSYEPSYYATYMLTGWVLLDYLRYRKVILVPGMNVIFWLLTAALVLSSSRLGWSMMIIWFVLRLVWRIREQAFSLPWRAIAIGGLATVFAVTAVASRYQVSAEDLNFLGAGLGMIDRMDAHSSQPRIDAATETLEVFMQHPIVGVSLGGVATALGAMRNSLVLDQESAKDNEAVNVTAEVLAASGAIGFIPFALYIYGLIRNPFRYSDKSELGAYAKALGWSFVFLYLALQFSPTILRSTVWLHIGILSAAYRVFRTTRDKMFLVAKIPFPVPAMG